MISIGDLKNIAKARLIDAEALASCHRYEGAVYLCGYAVELGLKNRICKTLKWEGFPGSTKEFQGYQSFKTHNLDILLHLSGGEDIKGYLLNALLWLYGIQSHVTIQWVTSLVLMFSR